MNNQDFLTDIVAEKRRGRWINWIKKIMKISVASVSVIPVVVIIVVIAGIFNIVSYVSTHSSKDKEIQKQLSVVKGVVATQMPSVPGEPIKWTKMISASTIMSGQHLLEIPKTAQQVKITPVTNVTKTVKKSTVKPEDRVGGKTGVGVGTGAGAGTGVGAGAGANKTLLKKSKSGLDIVNPSNLNASTTIIKQNRLKLSELSKQIAKSPESLALAKSLDKQNKEKINSTLSQGHVSSFFAKIWDLFVSVGSRMTASVEDAIQAPASLVPEVTVVDVLPQTETVQPSGSGSVQNSPSDIVNTNTPTAPDTTLSTSTSVPPPATSSNEAPVETANNGSVPTTSATPTPTTTTNTTPAISTASPTPSTTSPNSTTHATPTTTTTTTSPSLANPTTPSTPATPTTATSTTTATDVLVEYQTPAPTIAEATTDTGKIVTVSDSAGEAEGQTHTTNVLAFTNIPSIYKVGQESKIKIKWLNNNNQDVQFHAYDLNGDGKLDYVEWTVPHLSTQTFEIIFISKALELDENGEIIGDIYDQVKNQDNNWATIADGHTVQVTFEKFLTNKNDNTIYARPNGSTTSVRIDVYPVYDGVASDQSVATFSNIDIEKMYKVLLPNLPKSTNTFNLKVTGSVDIDYIVDPTPVTVTDTFHNSSKISQMTNLTMDTTNGSLSLSPASSWACGSTLLDIRDTKTYATVLIGSQCWMQQNLNVGTRIAGVSNQGTSSVSIQKYCYGDLESNCTSGGGLYQWNQTMAGSQTAGATGICPAGWHVPTHDEFTLLERTTCTSGTCATDFPYDITTMNSWRGTNEGTTLKNMSGLFRGVLTGTRYTDGSFGGGGSLTYFWSSVGSGGSAWYRNLNSGNASVNRNSYAVAIGFSVRCLKN